MSRKVWLYGIAMLWAGSLWAQNIPTGARRTAVARLTDLVTQTYTDAPTAAMREGLLRARISLVSAVTQIAAGYPDVKPDPEDIRRAVVPAFEEARTDKQAGAGAQTSGSTSLVSKGSIAGVIGLAVENGALTQTTSGTTITFQGTPIGILDALRQRGFIEGYDASSNVPLFHFLRRVGFSTSFDTSRDNSESIFTGDKQQLSAYSFRLELVNRRDPRHPAYRVLWQTAANEALNLVANTKNTLDRRLLAMKNARPALAQWEENLVRALLDALQQNTAEDAREKAVAGVLEKAIDDLELHHPEVFEGLDPLIAAIDLYVGQRNSILKAVSRGVIATYEFTDNRQVGQPDLLNHRVIFESDLLGNGKSDFTLNASVTHFSNTSGLPQGTNGLRDFQLGAQLDLPFADNGAFQNWVFTTSWRYMRLLESQKIPLTNLIAPTGVINLGQVKLTIPVKDGVKVPLALTWSNRTELVKEKRELRANLGITFDMDPLFARLKP